MISLGCLALAILLVSKLKKGSQQTQQMKAEYWQYLLHLKKLLGYFQYHRGLSYRYLNGQQSTAGEITEKQRLIAQELPSLALLARHPQLAEHWQALLDHWQRLQQSNLTLAMTDNLAQHNRLINTLLYLIEDVTELSSWSSKERKGLESVFAILQTTEWLGQARALGSGMLTAQQFSQAEQGQMGFIQGKLQDCLQLHTSNKESLNKLLTLSQHISGHFIDPQSNKSELTGSQYFNLASSVIDSYMTELDAIISRLQRI
jgi:hypothetical protein